VIAGLMGFGATRMLGRRAALYLVGERDLQRTEVFYERWGVYAVAFGRAVGGPAEWAVILAGLSRMPFSSVLGALILGGFVSGMVVAALGAVAVTRPLLAAAITVALLGAMLLAGRIVTRASASRS
jgi:membrane protein DedA with SNARE-associated domain